MKKTKYDNEKVIFGHGVATTKITDPQRDFMLFFEGELDKITVGKRGLKLLDVGCGAGDKTKAIRNRYPSLSIYACDNSKNAIKEANKKPENIKFATSDATKLLYKNNEFDIVIMNSVLDHTDDPQRSIYEVARVLKSGGIYLVTSPLEADMATVHGLLTKFYKPFRGFRNDRLGHNFAFSRSILLKMIEKSFRIKKTQYSWFWFAQIIDLAYYPLLMMLGKSPDKSIDDYITTGDTFTSKLLKQVRKLFAFIQNSESVLFRYVLPGYFIYIKAVKK